MAIEKRKCEVCDSEFYGSKNKKTCSGKCRTAKHRQKNGLPKDKPNKETDIER